MLEVAPEMSLTKLLNSTAHLYFSNWQIPTHWKEWPGSLLSPGVQKHVALPPLGEACFYWTLCGTSFLPPHQKKENKSRRSRISPLFYYYSNNTPYLFVPSSFQCAHWMCVQDYSEAAPLYTDCTLSLSGQMHRMEDFSFFPIPLLLQWVTYTQGRINEEVR